MAKSTLKSIPVYEEENIDVKIESMAYDNSAIARYKDFIVFVDRGAPGDYVKADITTIRPNYARAKILEMHEFDPQYRIEPPCKIYKVCGGCQWQHLPYEKQLEQKDFLMKQFTAKLDLKEDVLKNIIGAESNEWHYRNKVQYPVRTVESTGRLKAGYFEWHSNDLINIKYCPIQYSQFDEIVETVRELAPKYKIIAYDGKKKTGWLRHICLRLGVNTGEVLLTLVAINENLSKSQDFANEIMKKHPEIVGVCININTGTTNVIYGPKTKVLKGKGCINEEINDLKFKISATSFFQVNTPQATKLINVINDFTCRDAPPGHLYDCILDAYCGVGFLALSLAKQAKKVIGIEEIKQAIDDARVSANFNNIDNITFINGKVENKIIDVLEKEHIDVVILDPPRAGCNKKILESILKVQPQKIIYVSCNPTTLVRDLEILKQSFNIKLIQPIDMFPHTYHVECVVLLEK